ncbi:hypothetical protein AbSZ3_45 [Acinetobacter phage Ab_SZ3]|uniref:Uncharacterized protein n=1 Tax=Acinetobacter phage Ab_SZ3 TaxID=2781361 RepID=A0A873WEW8_9CAUD|nr:hypothetical protein AbSZ3_45 [Acinetobacter phage Ab_SZ3]
MCQRFEGNSVIVSYITHSVLLFGITNRCNVSLSINHTIPTILLFTLTTKRTSKQITE